MSNLAFIVALEEDTIESTEEYVDGFANLIRTNIIHNLQGSWQRAAQHLIDDGILNWRGDVLQYPEA